MSSVLGNTPETTGDEGEVLPPVTDVSGDDGLAVIDDETTVPPSDQLPTPEEWATAHGRDESEYWQQQSENGMCVPMSVTMTLNEFGIAADEASVARVAVENGWLTGEPVGGLHHARKDG